ncbi:MAG TPA: ABC transporter substrate-binding protein, partial [Vicinamibacteria bacterium]|nr:ABC transporter substrate-binding protein [Vicinamibacteria bacterium]
MRRAAALLLVTALASCAAPSSPPPGAAAPATPVEPVVLDRPAPPPAGGLGLAAIFPTVGRFSLSGIQSLNGARLAVEDVNRSGGIHGRALVLLPYRTGSYFVDAGRAARLAEAEGRALAIVGSNASSLSEAIAEVAEGRGIPQVSNVSTADDLTWDPVTGEDRPFVFRVCGSDAHMGGHLARFADGHLRARRVAILYEVGRTYSAKLARSFAERFASPGEGRVVAEFFYLPLETDFRTQLREVAAFRPDVVFLPGSFTDATLIAMQAEQIGLRATLLGGDAWSNQLLFKRGGPGRPAF